MAIDNNGPGATVVARNTEAELQDCFTGETMTHICHLTSVHPRYDTRIFLKQCRSLAAAGYRVTLVVADGQGDEVREGVRIRDVGTTAGGRLARILRTARAVGCEAVRTGATVFHLHDPELMPVGLRLKRLGYTVVFDAHEDFPKQLLSKHYMGRGGAYVVSSLARVYERYACQRFDAIVTATSYIRDKFLRINPESLDINNYPMVQEFVPPDGNGDFSDIDSSTVCYVGGVGTIRGIIEMVKAIELTAKGTRLAVAGPFSEQQVFDQVRLLPGWENVEYRGVLDRTGVRDMLHTSIAGIVTLHPTINYIDALPVKMFEYMSAGIPVIASHFPLWREIVEGSHCGICVDPQNPREIAAAIDYLVSHPDDAQRMGANGRRAVEERYNWNVEEKKLLALYDKLTADKGTTS